MRSITEFELSVHNCKRCKREEFGSLIKFYPILSFGDPTHKPLLVVGLNPSTREYEDNFVLDCEDPIKRHHSQINYFKCKNYGFFKHLAKLFNGDAQTALRWVKTPWEEVGFIDLIKCPTRTLDGGQWTSIKPKSRRSKIISNCKGFLEKQLEMLNPTVILAYGADVCRWFFPEYKQVNHEFSIITIKKKGQKLNVILVPQTRGSHPNRTILKIRNVISKALE